ncbi:sulfur acquisition oxidoreductase, SfnB family [Paenibacillus sp. UNC496MF]|uniref:SfnB family sulfur acquisition oxidoreductase n=1 Tax=Paenibacillus sp. UNC496MF TaxID=1502753 RepID=UPI0008EA92C8|nr:SfnB family sulfur acquisition oxidoreductase [Paenibacillus sp. UNC496MF]SFJ34673.1 sulfur acquisition oxidoreductase, SfnB family [Paenibacillus sp. UNC496MF]
MSINLEALSAAEPGVPHGLALAYALGELPMDLRRNGIAVTRDSGSYRLLRKQGHDDFLAFEDPVRALRRLAAGDSVAVIGLQLTERRHAILVRSGSALRSAADLKGAVIGIAEDDPAMLGLRKREAAKQIDEALQQAGIAAGRPTLSELSAANVQEGGGTRRRALQALLQGEADAVYVERGDAIEARRWLEVRELEDVRPVTPELTALLVSARWLREEQEAIARILGHLHLAAEWAVRHPQEANRLAAAQLGVPERAIGSLYSERLHRQFGVDVTDSKWHRFVRLHQELKAGGWLQGEFALDAAQAQALQREAMELAESGEIERPQREPLSLYAERDLPLAFFNERPRAQRLRSDEEALEAARIFADEIRPGASDRDRGRRLPLNEMRRLAELGLLGLVVPKAYGGPEISTRTLVDIFKLISHADGSIGQIPQNHHFFVKTIALIGSEQQKRFFFGEVMNGAQFGNGLAERSRGRGARKIATSLRASDGTDDDYVLDGSKFYSTGALYAHWIPVTALNEAEQRMTAFVPRHAAGVAVLDDWSGIGQRTTASGSVVLRNVKVPGKHVLPHWRIFEGPQYFSAFGQIMHAAIDIGIARAALEDAAAFVRTRTRPAYGSGVATAAEEPDLIRRFGELGIRLQAAEALLDRAAGAIDLAKADLNAQTAGQATLTVDSAKWLVTETAIEITNALFEVAGTSSMDRKYNLDRHWRNVRIHTLHDPARLKLHHVGKWFLNGVYHEYRM